MAEVVMRHCAETDPLDPLDNRRLTTANIYDGPNQYDFRVFADAGDNPHHVLNKVLASVVAEAFRLGKGAR